MLHFILYHTVQYLSVKRYSSLQYNTHSLLVHACDTTVLCATVCVCTSVVVQEESSILYSNFTDFRVGWTARTSLHTLYFFSFYFGESMRLQQNIYVMNVKYAQIVSVRFNKKDS